MNKQMIEPARPGKSICFVTTDFAGPTSPPGVGTYYNELAKLLSKNGWNVVVLFYSHVAKTRKKYSEKYFKEHGIAVYGANQLCREGKESSAEIQRDSPPVQARSHLFHQALEVLARKYEYEFDLIEFPELNAPGFIPVRLNKNLRLYEGSRLIVKLHGPSSWMREVNKQEFATENDLKLDFMEKYSFEHADIQTSTTENLLHWCQEHGWKVREDATCCPACIGVPPGPAGGTVEELSEPDSIVSWYEEMLCRQGSRPQPKSVVEAKTEPMVTVIIPYYNTHRYVQKTLLSLSNQTYKNFSIIMVNDGSDNPESLAMLERIKARSPDILVLNKQNGGIGSARNHALPYIDAKYIVAVDADNIARPEMIDTFVRSMENRGDNVAALSCYSAIFMDQDEASAMKSIASRGTIRPRGYYKPLGACLPLLFFNNIQGDVNSIYQTAVIKSVGGWSENKHASEDWALWLKLIASGCEIDVIPQVLYWYRISATQETKRHSLADKDKNNLEFIRLLMKKRPDDFFRSYVALHMLTRGLNQEVNLLAQRYLIERAIAYYRVHGLIDTIRRLFKYLT